MNKLAYLTLIVLFVSFSSCKNDTQKSNESMDANDRDTSSMPNDNPETEPTSNEGFDITKIAISNAELGDFPYFKLPEGYIFTDPDHFSNGEGKGLTLDFDKEYFLNDGVYFPMEGKTFKGHINLDKTAKDKRFTPLQLQKSFDDLISKMGGVKMNNGKGYKSGEKNRINTLDSQAEPSGYLNSSQYYDNIHTYVIRKPDYNVFVQCNFGGETGYITVLKTEAFKNNMTILKSDQIQKDLKEKGKVVLHINFDTDKATLKPDGKEAVAEITNALKNNSDLKIRINGYTDTTGNDVHNLQLSKDRANAVKLSIIASGIDGSRLSSDGFGSKNPIADNSSEDGKSQNRRVELIKI